MDDGTAEEEKENTQPNRTRNQDNNSERRVNWGNKGTDQLRSPTKEIPRKTKSRSREYKKHRKNSNGDRRKMTLHSACGN
jgi:hypothetical protein